MWLSVGSSSSLIVDMGHVGMFAVSTGHQHYLSGRTFRQTTRKGA
jgi:hypothetical protein